MRNVLVTGKIERWIKEMVFAAISQDRNCHYCTAAHLACCRMLGVDPAFLNSLVRDVNSLTDAKLRDMILFRLNAPETRKAYLKPTTHCWATTDSVSLRYWN